MSPLKSRRFVSPRAVALLGWTSVGPQKVDLPVYKSRYSKHKRIAQELKWPEFEGYCAELKGCIYYFINLNKIYHYRETTSNISICVGST